MCQPDKHVPNEQSVAEFAMSLEREGWLYRSERGPVWEITPDGRAELARLEDAEKKER